VKKKSEAGATQEGMTLYGHLGELRRRLLYILLFVLAGSVAAWQFAQDILGLVMRPLLSYLPPEQGLIFTGLQDAFAITFKISLWAGAIVSSPLWLYQIWAFVAPGLRPGEKAKVPGMVALATALLLAGVAFAYFLAFPITFRFFLTFSSETLMPLLAADRYLSLAMGLVAAFAISFQLPLILMFLGRLNIVSSRFLKKYRSYAIVIIFVLAAVLTPPDVMSQCLLAVTLILLYELSIFLIGPEKGKTEDTEAAGLMAGESGKAGPAGGDVQE
jgi:sec-independent protein translocase protein TatC